MDSSLREEKLKGRVELPMDTKQFQNMNRRMVYLIGAPRCGTTSVASWLEEHPQICFSRLKEPWYLNTDFGPRKITKERDYRRLYKHLRDSHKIMAEASTTYLYSAAARKSIADNPEAIVLIMVRSPIDMFRSWHLLKVQNGEENLEDPKEAWNANSMRKKGLDVPKDCREPRWLIYDEMCNLGSWIEKWIADLDDDRVKVLLLDDLHENREDFFFNLSELLQIDLYLPNKKRTNINKTSIPRVKLLRSVIKTTSSIRRRILPAYLSFGILNRIAAWNSKEIDKDDIKKLTPSFENDLRVFFSTEIVALEKLTGRDLSSWM